MNFLALEHSLAPPPRCVLKSLIVVAKGSGASAWGVRMRYFGKIVGIGVCRVSLEEQRSLGEEHGMHGWGSVSEVSTWALVLGIAENFSAIWCSGRTDDSSF